MLNNKVKMLIVNENSQFYSIFAGKKGGNANNLQIFFSPKLLFLEVKNIKPIFPWKVKNMKICSNHENLRTIEAQPKITGSYKKKVCSGQPNPNSIGINNCIRPSLMRPKFILQVLCISWIHGTIIDARYKK